MNITAIIMKVDEPNKNGRTYSRKTMEKAIEDFMGRPTQFGMLGMPDNLSVDISRISHQITDLRINEAGEVVAKIKVLETPHGQIARRLLESQVRYDFRTAGAGNIDEKGFVTNFQIASINMVQDGA